MGPQPRLRPITDDDLLLVLELNARDVDLLAPLDADRLDQLRGWAQHADVIDLGEQVAGFVLTFAAGTAYDSENYRWFGERFGRRPGDFSYLDRIVIGQSFRRRGLAQFVYDTLEAEAAPTGRMALEVNLDPPNEGSLAFHHGRGYVDLDSRGVPGHVVTLMVKEL